jgi:N-acetylglucosamine malate deacetylase 1
MSKRLAMAIGAHPDDIEFMMGGTLLLLKQAGFETHYLNLANGSCGSSEHSAAKVISARRKEAKAAAAVLGATFHESLVNDLEIFYDLKTLRRISAILREVHPTLLLVPSPQDYMEDHTNTCRLVVTAAFARGMPNFKTFPPRQPVTNDITLYHAMPHGLHNPLRGRILPGAFVNTTSVHSTKMAALAEHRSQQNWLDSSQKINRYLHLMEEFSLEVGRMSRQFYYAEGWRRHLHYGFCAEQADPLREALGANYLVNKHYESLLKKAT